MEDVPWHKSLWFKGYALNYALYAWLAINGGLKTFEVLSYRGIGTLLNCLQCGKEVDSHSHLFSSCSFSLSPIRNVLTIGSFFLLEPSILQVFISIDVVEHSTLRRLNLLITVITIDEIWKERNRRDYNTDLSEASVLIKHIKLKVAHKIRR